MTANLYHLRIPPDLARAAQQLAVQRRTTVGQILRDLLTAEVAAARTPAPEGAPVLSARQKQQLVALIDGARSWDDLKRKLALQGYDLKPIGNGLAIVLEEDGTRLCKTGEVGHSYDRLVKRFGAPFPGHPHAWMAARVLHAPAPAPVSGRLNQVIADTTRSTV